MFLENLRGFLENAEFSFNLNYTHFSCLCHAVIPVAHMITSQRDWLQASLNTDNSVPIKESTFQSADAHLPVSWALPALKIATLGIGWLPSWAPASPGMTDRGLAWSQFHRNCDHITVKIDSGNKSKRFVVCMKKVGSGTKVNLRPFQFQHFFNALIEMVRKTNSHKDFKKFSKFHTRKIKRGKDDSKIPKIFS